MFLDWLVKILRIFCDLKKYEIAEWFWVNGDNENILC